MKRGWVVTGVIALAVVGVWLCSKPSGYSAQYITLPSGWKAYCNRQGYREVQTHFSGNELVTNPDGSFVPCDARVGPEWDDKRTSWSGRLLTPEEMDQAQYDAQGPEREKEEQEGLARKDWQDRMTFAWKHCISTCDQSACTGEEVKDKLYSPEFNAAYEAGK